MKGGSLYSLQKELDEAEDKLEILEEITTNESPLSERNAIRMLKLEISQLKLDIIKKKKEIDQKEEEDLEKKQLAKERAWEKEMDYARESHEKRAKRDRQNLNKRMSEIEQEYEDFEVLDTKSENYVSKQIFELKNIDYPIERLKNLNINLSRMLEAYALYELLENGVYKIEDFIENGEDGTDHLKIYFSGNKYKFELKDIIEGIKKWEMGSNSTYVSILILKYLSKYTHKDLLEWGYSMKEIKQIKTIYQLVEEDFDLSNFLSTLVDDEDDFDLSQFTFTIEELLLLGLSFNELVRYFTMDHILIHINKTDFNKFLIDTLRGHSAGSRNMRVDRLSNIKQLLEDMYREDLKSLFVKFLLEKRSFFSVDELYKIGFSFTEISEMFNKTADQFSQSSKIEFTTNVLALKFMDAKFILDSYESEKILDTWSTIQDFIEFAKYDGKGNSLNDTMLEPLLRVYTNLKLSSNLHDLMSLLKINETNLICELIRLEMYPVIDAVYRQNPHNISVVTDLNIFGNINDFIEFFSTNIAEFETVMQKQYEILVKCNFFHLKQFAESNYKDPFMIWNVYLMHPELAKSISEFFSSFNIDSKKLIEIIVHCLIKANEFNGGIEEFREFMNEKGLNIESFQVIDINDIEKLLTEIILARQKGLHNLYDELKHLGITFRSCLEKSKIKTATKQFKKKKKKNPYKLTLEEEFLLIQILNLPFKSDKSEKINITDIIGFGAEHSMYVEYIPHLKLNEKLREKDHDDEILKNLIKQEFELKELFKLGFRISDFRKSGLTNGAKLNESGYKHRFSLITDDHVRKDLSTFYKSKKGENNWESFTLKKKLF